MTCSSPRAERQHPADMTEVTIDSSKLPGVKEVCKDFAVLEDHSLAHSLQEQEIEHHLATNVKRSRLVKHDLQVAKQLQEIEDLRTQVTIKHHHDERELLDGEIAQEIQEKLVIEAERKRLQEEKDEDIARILQEREEKRRKKQYPPRSPEDPPYPDHEGHRSKGHRESPPAKPGSGVKARGTRDADIARRLQEEEIRVNTVDYKAAQLAQDEELARWLMEKEQQSYKKSKGREKMSDRKRPDERELTSHEHGRPRSREEQHRSRSDKPYRPLPLSPDEDHSDDYTNHNPHNSPRSGSKSHSSHKGSYYRQ